MIIFDFDLTLVDTQPVATLRDNLDWDAVMRQVPKLEVYDGINNLLKELHDDGQTLAIVTKSPNMIPKAFVKLYKWPIEIVLGSHQVGRGKLKPHPDGLLKAMSAGNATAENTFHVGDKPEDTEAARAAGVTAIGAGWGNVDVASLEASNPDYLFKTVAELQEFFLKSP
ncbi:MAG: HAD family hydrolase [Pseudohongiellaceae bacterium]